MTSKSLPTLPPPQKTLKETEEAKRYYSASQFQLILWRFKKHKIAQAGAWILIIMAFVGLFAEFFGPYAGTTRASDAVLVAPQKPQFCNDEGCSIRPFLPGIVSERNPDTLRMETKIDPTVRRDIYFFVEGEPYKLLGTFDMTTHFFGVKEGTIHLFGTDSLGRDIFSRLLLATRTSLSIGIIGVVIAFLLALVIGGASGYFGGGLDYGIQRLTEIVRVIPVIPLYMGLAAAFPKEWSSTQVYFAMTLILALVGWPTLARRIRGKLLSLRGEDYIVAASLSGASSSRIIGRHLLPAFTSYIIVDLVISFPYMLLSETALSFVGLGLRPPTISWGVLLQDAQTVRAIEQAPWLFIPAIFVVVAVLSFTVLGDGLRDAADPYQVSN
ncbi:MAG TPA: ABC transporter permease [Anaerolineales bacterium]|nr:ABC transporter permease [Anaerolineales bacterium]